MLIAVAGVALAIAAGMGVMMVRMLREERRRSDARVQLLTDLAGEGALATAKSPTRTIERPVRTPQPSLALRDLAIRPEAAAAGGARDLFHGRAAPSAWPRRFAVIGTMAAVLMLAVFGYRSLSLAARGRTMPAAATAPSVAPTNTPPLELLSLRHAQADGVLTVAGLVQNPRSGVLLSSVNATLFVFGPGGSFITSARAPLDFTSLTPGDESPFVIRVPVSRAVERYRVGFRDDDDRMLAHVDRRSVDTVAQK